MSPDDSMGERLRLSPASAVRLPWIKSSCFWSCARKNWSSLLLNARAGLTLRGAGGGGGGGSFLASVFGKALGAAFFAVFLAGAGFATFWTAFLPGAFLAGTFFAGAFLAGAFLAAFLGALFFTVFFAAFFAGREGFRVAFLGFFFFVAMLYLSFRTVPCRTSGNNPGFR